MGTEHLRIELSADEYAALATLARRDLRPLPAQARFLLRAALRRQGLLRRGFDPEGEENAHGR